MPIDISQIKFPTEMNIREAALYLELGEQRVRALHRTKVIPASDVSGRLIFKKADLDAYKSQPRTQGARKEGTAGKAFVIHVTGEKLAAVQKFLEGQGIKLEPRYNYAKMKDYQQKRNAAKRAAKAGAVVPSTANKDVVPAAPAKSGVGNLLQRKTG